LTKLPVLPSELPPPIFQAAYPDEQAVACPRNGFVNEVSAIAATFGCRSVSQSSPSILQLRQPGPAPQDFASSFMLGMQQMMQQQQQHMFQMTGCMSGGMSGGRSGGIVGNLRSNVRSLQNVQDSGYQGMLPPGMQLESGPPRLQLQDGKESLTPERPAAAIADEEEEEPAPANPAPANPDVAGMMAMLDAREAEKDIEKAQKKKEEADKKKAEKTVAPKTTAVGQKRPAAATADEDEKEPCKITMKKHKSGKGKLATAGKIKSKDKPRKTAKMKHKDCKDKTPRVGVEWSRSRVQCRSGKAGPGQNLAFKFGPGCTYKTVKEAMAEANKWLAKERSRRGL
jgi:hypothetical protein